MTRWLDDDEQRTWRNFLAATRLVHEALERQMQRDAGMPHTYYVILAVLSEQPGRTMRMSDLAVKAGCSQSRLSHAVRRLEEHGWVRREQDSSDRRSHFAVLTDEGYAVLESAAPGHVEEVRRSLFDVLTPEQVRRLDEICSAVRNTLEG